MILVDVADEENNETREDDLPLEPHFATNEGISIVHWIFYIDLIYSFDFEIDFSFLRWIYLCHV